MTLYKYSHKGIVGVEFIRLSIIPTILGCQRTYVHVSSRYLNFYSSYRLHGQKGRFGIQLVSDGKPGRDVSTFIWFNLLRRVWQRQEILNNFRMLEFYKKGVLKAAATLNDKVNHD
ncbi:PREDICTED: uncharacterized protein LOC108966876 [Bactrocera latifrons]|uniref:uncharacterized protein LOC108966876 n=1 Tax=Bactrocera latifrons TaxID=174628 RepID=UPI0008DC884A|nr:PREDICTED: uncharacterized protein LOC108966876 [Bactrocera latifrons]